MKETLTVFTPTYNRAYILSKLYKSLCLQTSKDFIWLIVDDGSTDDTEKIVQEWVKDDIIKIKYVKQDNGGKMRAYNHGVRLCDTELFVCEDSDDYMPDKAIEKIIHFWTKNKSLTGNIGGILAYAAMRTSDANNPIVRCRFPNRRSGKLCSLYRKEGFFGETVIVFRSSVIKKFPFPEIDGEKFITEAVVYEKVDKEYDLLYYDDYLSIYEYQEDGYTRNSSKLFLDNPKGWAVYYNTLCELWNVEFSFKEKLKSLTYYIVFSKIAGIKDIYNKSSDKSVRYILAYFLSPYYKYKLLKQLRK